MWFLLKDFDVSHRNVTPAVSELCVGKRLDSATPAITGENARRARARAIGMKKFMRTRSAGPLPPPLTTDAFKTNGHANGAALRRDDQHSTLSRYWSGSERGSERGARGARGALWEDAAFPAAAAALGPRRAPRDLLWLRPHELCSRPRFMGDSIVEGEGDAEGTEGPADEDEELAVARWRAAGGAARLPALGAAAAALAHTPRLLARVAPPHSFRRRYSGAFRFQFWVFGAWREVCVDDRLPARRSPRGPQLLCARSTASDDFTLPLLEKAYAKLYGSYAAARAAQGGVASALQELSGGVVQSFAPPRQPRALLLQVLHAAVPRCTLLVATVADLHKEKKSGARRLRNGLVTEQAYLVTGLARVRAAEGAEGEGALVRLRAASGVGEWAAAWARGSPEWRALPPPDRDLLAQRAAQPGHFWMSFGDFARAFGRLELVHVGPDDWLREPALHGKRPWRAVLARRRWRAGYNAGGPPRAATAHANPQFQLVVPPAAGDAPAAHAVVSLTQQYAPGCARRLHGIGFALYELPPGAPPRRAPLVSDLHELKPLDVTHESRAREVATFFTLPPGAYLLVPHTRRAHREAAFLLRVLTDRHADVWEVNDDNVIVRDIPTELIDEDRVMPARVAAAARRAAGRRGALQAGELDARALAAALRAAAPWCGAGAAGGRAVARALLALRDPGAAGRMAARELPALLALLALWRDAWARAARCGAVSAYELRALLWACGVRASNKVLECVVLRYARARKLHAEPFVLALARLHLAHERYRTLDTKLKSNPLSLEEMILMTIYS